MPLILKRNYKNLCICFKMHYLSTRQISERDQYLIKNRRIDERDEERERDVIKFKYIVRS
jgi:hypothetical protein